MPIYEFYCSSCHMVFNFLSRRIGATKLPSCPRCGKPELERQVSPFAVSRGQQEEPDTGMEGVDGARLEKAMQAMAGEVEGMDGNDPRQMARLMRKLTEAAGIAPGSRLEEAISRLESGASPEAVEEEFGDLLDEENPFSVEGLKGLKRKQTLPAQDETLYLLE